MTFALTAEQLEIREAVARLCQRFGDDYLAEKDSRGRLSARFHRAMAEAGWLGVRCRRNMAQRPRHQPRRRWSCRRCAIGSRVQRRLGGDMNISAAPGRRVRQRRAEAPVSAALIAASRGLLRGDRARCRLDTTRLKTRG